MRVVNQALGRVIRHKDDYGAIILADERFARPDMRNNISFWARQLLQVRAQFGTLGDELKAFFRDNDARAPRRPKRHGDSGRAAVAVLGKVRPPRCARRPLGIRSRKAVAHALCLPGEVRRRMHVQANQGGQQWHAQGAGGAPAPKRRAFEAPALQAGGGKLPRKAGAADSGASVLADMERSMSIPAARDVYGACAVDCREVRPCALCAAEARQARGVEWGSGGGWLRLHRHSFKPPAFTRAAVGAGCCRISKQGLQHTCERWERRVRGVCGSAGARFPGRGARSSLPAGAAAARASGHRRLRTHCRRRSGLCAGGGRRRGAGGGAEEGQAVGGPGADSSRLENRDD